MGKRKFLRLNFKQLIIMETVRILKIFLASPSDVIDERKEIFSLRDYFNEIIGKNNNIIFDFVNWEKNAYSGIGEDAQDVINKTTKSDYDIFLGIFWKKFGTKTNRAESGTVEEYNIALKKYQENPENIHLMFYFKTSIDSENIYNIDTKELDKIKNFREKLKKDGLLYYEFNETKDLRNLLLLHISNLVKDKFASKKRTRRKKTITIEKKIEVPKNNFDEFEKFEILAKKIEEGEYEKFYEEINVIANEANSFMNSLTPVISEIALTTTRMADKMTLRTEEINKIIHIKDKRLQSKSMKNIFNKSADDFDEYSDKLEPLVVNFSEIMNNCIQSYSSLVIKSIDSDVSREEIDSIMKNEIPEFYKSISLALDSSAEFIQSFIKINSSEATSKFKTSKRRAELCSNEMMKSMIQTKRLWKELIDNYK